MIFSIFLFSTLAHAGCPQIQLGDDTPATVKLEGQATACSPQDVFTCSQGSLRISGEVKSLTTGSRQITAYCNQGKNFRRPAQDISATKSNLDNEPGEDGEESAD